MGDIFLFATIALTATAFGLIVLHQLDGRG